MRFPRLLCTLIICCFGMAVGAPSAFSAEPGVVPDLSWGTSSTDQQRTVTVLQDSGSRWVRISVEWNQTEKTKGTLDPYLLARYDSAIAAAQQAGQKIIVMVYQAPQWASGSANKGAPPTSPSDYASFIGKLAARYKGKVAGWEIWNEQNISRFWYPTPSASAYTAMLKAAYPAVKNADPAAKVVFGGTSTNDYDYLAAAYAAGAKGYFDVLATHPYTCANSPDATNTSNGRLTRDTFTSYRELRKLMLANADDKPMWFTEFGWSTNTVSCAVSEANQAAYLTRAFQIMQADPYVQVATWYNLRNNYWSADANTMEDQFGLLRTDFTPKQAYGAFKTYALSLPLTQPALDTTAPDTQITSGPGTTTQFTGASFAFTGTDNVGVTGFDCQIDNGAWASCTSPKGYSSLPVGSHTFQVRAKDAAGNTDASPVAYTWTITPTTVNQPPTVTLTQPAAGSLFNGKLTVAAAASDDSAVARVEFYVDNTKICTEYNAPYACTWSVSRKLSYATHTISARAFDNAGLSTSSAVTATRSKTVALAAATRAHAGADRLGYQAQTTNTGNVKISGPTLAQAQLVSCGKRDTKTRKTGAGRLAKSEVGRRCISRILP